LGGGEKKGEERPKYRSKISPPWKIIPYVAGERRDDNSRREGKKELGKVEKKNIPADRCWKKIDCVRIVFWDQDEERVGI